MRQITIQVCVDHRIAAIFNTSIPSVGRYGERNELKIRNGDIQEQMDKKKRIEGFVRVEKARKWRDRSETYCTAQRTPNMHL